jgi:para-aminobenzoate synthetase component 1
MTFKTFVETLDDWGSKEIPFFFIVDFEQKKPVAFRLDEMPADILFDFKGASKSQQSFQSGTKIKIEVNAMAEESFLKKFNFVYKHLAIGDSYLTNLTVKNEIKISATLSEIFQGVDAKYKLLYRNEFLVFSPETFVNVRDGFVYSYPMKGTIDASIHDAEKSIIEDKKELAEHVTIVDLIRNDLSLVATDVSVERFRYIEKILSNQKNLLQVSSEIRGKLFPELEKSFGTLLDKLLPAGSISGAPKKKTVEIIQQAEGMERGYYTGVAGVFDGRVFDSGVLIRFIENDNGKFYYRSGGGITTSSEWKKEYREVIDKIYVPVN